MSGVWEQLDKSLLKKYNQMQTLDKYESGDILIDNKGDQLFWSGITLSYIDGRDNGQCQKEKKKGETYVRMASAVDAFSSRIELVRKTNSLVLENHSVSLSEKDKVRLPQLNKSGDLETIELVNNILIEKYGLDIRREGFQK